MEHISFEVKEKLHRSAVWDFYFSGRSVGVLDIETTGLDRARNHFILGGLLDLTTGIFHQVFAENTSEEAEALKLYMELIRGLDVVVTYNGRHFDLPFLEERLRRSGLAGVSRSGLAGVPGSGSAGGGDHAGLSDPSHDGGVPDLSYGGYDLDLYQVVNGHSPLRRLLPNLRQKTVETYMGLWTDRSDEISGAESVELYARFERTGDPQARQQILLHNSDDVLQLTRLVRVMDKCDFHRAMFHMGFPAGSPRRRWQIRKIRLEKDLLRVEGIQGNRDQALDYRGFALGSFPLQTHFDAKAGRFRMDIPILRQSGLAAVDLEAAGLREESFEKYPGSGSGFLVLQQQNDVQYREVDHLIREMVDRFEENL